MHPEVAFSPTVVANKQRILHECGRKATHVSSLPFYYHIYLNMPCNQKCIMCVPNGQHAKDILPFEHFVRFFEQIKPFAEHLTLIGGEPLIYPWIDQVLELLVGHSIEVTINTNATRLRRKVIELLLSLHALNLKCSIDAVNRATYYRIRGTDAFDTVCSNLREFSAAARDHANMRMILVYVVMRENLDEVVPFVHFAKRLAPWRIDFHPVRHVMDWHVTNDTGWVFDGMEQSCEAFKDRYNDVIRQAASLCEREGMQYDVQYL